MSEMLIVPSEILIRRVNIINRATRIKDIRDCRLAVERIGATHWATLRPHKGFKKAQGE
jgi:hypothetical protein